MLRTPLLVDKERKEEPTIVSTSHSTSSSTNFLATPEVELKNVREFYEVAATHFSMTRHSPWPKVRDFLLALPDGANIADVGCGNGKYLTLCTPPRLIGIGLDTSEGLISITASKNPLVNSFVGDALNVPLRSSAFDAAISIAVLHHLSSRERRLRAVMELGRIVKLGGMVLVYAWALEQDPSESRRAFEKQDVMVPWVLRQPKSQQPKAKVKAKPKQPKLSRKQRREQQQQGKEGEGEETEQQEQKSLTITTVDTSKQKENVEEAKSEGGDGQVVLLRYCHVFKEGELEELFQETGCFEVLDSYYDTSNWCVRARKIEPKLQTLGEK